MRGPGARCGQLRHDLRPNLAATRHMRADFAVGGSGLLARAAAFTIAFGTATAWCGTTGGSPVQFYGGTCYDCGDSPSMSSNGDCYSCQTYSGYLYPYDCGQDCSNTPCSSRHQPPPTPPVPPGQVACRCCSGAGTKPGSPSDSCVEHFIGFANSKEHCARKYPNQCSGCDPVPRSGSPPWSCSILPLPSCGKGDSGCGFADSSRSPSCTCDDFLECSRSSEGGTCSSWRASLYGLVILMGILGVSMCLLLCVAIFVYHRHRNKAQGGTAGAANAHAPLLPRSAAAQQPPQLSVQEVTSPAAPATAQTGVVPVAALSLHQFVMVHRLQDFEAALNGLGIAQVSGFQTVTDEQLLATGMNIIHVNRVRKQVQSQIQMPLAVAAAPEPEQALEPEPEPTVDASVEL